MKFRIILTVVLFSLLTFGAGASDLHFVIHNVDGSLGGYIAAGLYASADGYPDGGGEIAHTDAVVNGSTARGVFRNLPPGRYVIALLHDLDGDRQMKFSGLGLPKEGYGFSGVTRPVSLPPKFDKAAVELDGVDDGTVDCYMKY